MESQSRRLKWERNRKEERRSRSRKWKWEVENGKVNRKWSAKGRRQW